MPGLASSLGGGGGAGVRVARVSGSRQANGGGASTRELGEDRAREHQNAFELDANVRGDASGGDEADVMNFRIFDFPSSNVVFSHGVDAELGAVPARLFRVHDEFAHFRQASVEL